MLRAQLAAETAAKEKLMTEKLETEKALAQKEKEESRIVVVRTKAEHLHHKSDYAKLIFKVIRLKLWKFFKFMPTDEAQLKTLLGSVLVFMKQEKAEQALCVETPRKIAQWNEENHDLITLKINNNRSGVLNAMKDVMENYWRLELDPPQKNQPDNRKLPSLEKILMIATRSDEVDLEDGDDRDLAILWYDKILTSACNNKVDFDLRRSKKVSDIPGMTVQTEAHALVVYDNYRDCWQEQFKIKSRYGWGKKLVVWSTNKPENAVPGTDHTLAGELVHLHDAKYMAKWTKQNAGAVKEGAWTLEGRNKYNHYLKMISKARKSDHCDAFEDALQEKMGELGDVPDPEAEENQARKKRKTQKSAGPKHDVDLALLAKTIGVDLTQFGVAASEDDEEESDQDSNLPSAQSNNEDDDDAEAQDDDAEAQDDGDDAEEGDEDGDVADEEGRGEEGGDNA